MSIDNLMVFTRSKAPPIKRCIFLDLETCGFNPFHHSILEIACIDNSKNQFQSLINPGIPIPTKITEITNINDELVKDYKSEYEILLEFDKYLKQDPTNPIFIIGHNIIGFDIPFLKARYNKYNLEFPKVYPIDTLKMAQFIYPQFYSHSLVNLTINLGLGSKTAHRAMNDVENTMKLYSILKNEFISKYNNCSYKFIREKTQLIDL
jgi:DNA polymerase-3 subunit alpha (Gram-positive type)